MHIIHAFQYIELHFNTFPLLILYLLSCNILHIQLQHFSILLLIYTHTSEALLFLDLQNSLNFCSQVPKKLSNFDHMLPLKYTSWFHDKWLMVSTIDDGLWLVEKKGLRQALCAKF